MENMTWIKTDDAQWIKRIDNQTYTVIQIILWGDEGTYAVDVQYIDFSDYTMDELIKTICSFGYQPTDIDDINGQILAEMLAEDTADKQVDFVGSYEECYNWVLDFIA